MGVIAFLALIASFLWTLWVIFVAIVCVLTIVAVATQKSGWKIALAVAAVFITLLLL